MRSLVTGGAGFIGSHLVEALLARGDEVSVLDDLSTGSRANLAAVAGHPRLVVHEDSVMRRTRVSELVRSSDRVFHLAAAVGVRLVVESPARTIETNVRGTELVLELAAEHGRPVLLASSSEVYGRGRQLPFREEDDLLLGPPNRLRWGYACSKALGEFLALAYAKERGLPVVVVRLFNTVGPRQTGRYGMVLPRFAAQALAGEPLTVYGNGSQTRSFAWVGDVVEALVRLLESPRARGDFFNLGGERETSILALAELVRATARSSSPIHFVPYAEAWGERFDDMERRVPSLAKIRRTIDYAPKLDLEEIVRRVLDAVPRS